MKYGVTNNYLSACNSSGDSASEEIVAKIAKTGHPINELIAKRWSARAFSTKPVEKSKLLSILEVQDGPLLPKTNNHGGTLSSQKIIQKN